MQNINGEKTSLIFGKETRHMHGEEYIQETLGNLKEGWRPDVIVADPPSTGLDQALLRTILKEA
ncbi:23S rRNA (uracil-5-)-methyltransferase RumA [Mycobacteroides abscessus subsp. abscessus]|nr:23S rRNA (uracil-5-)-methyltransferase RumA [Mycobacteroides abscessus subsp. abscessus]